MRGLASNAIFILATIGIIVAAGIIIFWKWFSVQQVELSEFACIAKQKSYCSSLINGENPNWNEIKPETGCENYGITQPTLEECKRL